MWCLVELRQFRVQVERINHRRCRQLVVDEARRVNGFRRRLAARRWRFTRIELGAWRRLVVRQAGPGCLGREQIPQPGPEARGGWSWLFLKLGGPEPGCPRAP